MRPSLWLGAILIADAAMDSLSGGAGWFGAGLLGLVLGWLLLVNLPAKDKQLKDLIDNKDKQFKDLVDNHEQRLIASMTQQRTDFKVSLDIVVQHCARETSQMGELLRQEIRHLASNIERLQGRHVKNRESDRDKEPTT